MGYGQVVDRVLSRMNDVSPVSVEEYDGTNEWFLVEGDDLYDEELYQLLRSKWFQITGANYSSFALLYGVQRPDTGVWVHSLRACGSPQDYARGCYKISSWR